MSLVLHIKRKVKRKRKY